ncbi:branched-chain amino acid ABC transporter permease [Azospirillum endophyticum]
MVLFLNQLLSGVATGSIYACIALAIVMIYQAIDHVNFAQGEMAMFSTFIAYQLMQWGMPYWAAFVAAVVVSFIAGVAIERALFRPLQNASVMVQLAGFIALFLIVNSTAGLLWGYTVKVFPSPFGGGSSFVGLISGHQLGMVAITLILLALLFLFFRFTRVGLAMRAAATQPESARLVGINVGWMIGLGWGLAAAIGAIAGIMIAPVVFLEPNMMGGILIYGFAGAVLGGLSNPAGAVVGGVLVGIIDNLAGTYIPSVGHELKLSISLGIIVLVLVFKPAGLFARQLLLRV